MWRGLLVILDLKLVHAIFQMKGEKELVEQILQTEIKLFNAIRDGSALMQHMEDFYYVTLLEVCYWCTFTYDKYSSKVVNDSISHRKVAFKHCKADFRWIIS